ncbi:MAG: type II/IV secretion system protein [Epsilonproteobacteria bacterium]|nr:type II/IV secretion system protein [Campylobacterota bacterium]
MQKIIEELIKQNLVDKKKLLNVLSKISKNSQLNLKLLFEEDIINRDGFAKFVAKKIRSGEYSIEFLEKLEQDGIDTTFILEELARELNIRFVNLDEVEVEMHLLEKFPLALLEKHKALPIEESDLNILVAFADPLDLGARDAIQRLFPRKPIAVAIAHPTKIIQNLQRLETSESVKEYIEAIKRDMIEGGVESDEESPAVLKLIELILKDAIVSRTSDIHIEATEKSCIVRDRIDGMLQQHFIFDKMIFDPLASRIKLLANLDIAEKRKPQDGRFSATINQKEYDFRVSTLPTLLGESIVLRILDKSKALIKLEEMGMSEDNYKKFSSSIKAPYGIVLVTGPTGSGKTTTLYGALNAIKDVKDKIITVEDPVEYQMAGIQQVQVNPQAGLTFASALRSILRQDPDKIMIGEIRDSETLRIAVQAALTGHLVLSTLHTNDAVGAIPRMVDMGVESYLISGTIVAIQAQRLVRKICPFCKEESDISPNVYEEIKEYIPEGVEAKFYKGKGCKKCHNTGYMGREMISEVLVVSDKLSRMIAADATKEALEDQALKEGFVPMFADGVLKALKGETTIDEIFRVARL